MAIDTSASIIPLHQPQKKVPKTPAERARDYRARLKAEKTETPAALPVPAPVTVTAPVTPVTVTSRAVTPSHRPASILLMLAAFGLAGVGMTMNGWFARSLGSSDIAGWLFLGVGVPPAAHDRAG